MPAVATTSSTPGVISMMSPSPSVDTRICALWTAMCPHPTAMGERGEALAHGIGDVPRLARLDDLAEVFELLGVDRVAVLLGRVAPLADLGGIGTKSFDHRSLE